MNTDKIYAEQIANEYAPKDTSKVVALKKLDAKAKLPATVFTYTLGIVSALVFGTGMCLAMKVIGSGTVGAVVLGVLVGVLGVLGMGVNYPAYKRILANGKKKYAFEIMQLAKEISEKQAKQILLRAVFPPRPVVLILPSCSFAATIFVFVRGLEKTAAAYPVFFFAAYSLMIVIAAFPKTIKRLRTSFPEVLSRNGLFRKVASTEVGDRYLHDRAFRGSVGVRFGMTTNLFYALFRGVVGILHSSVWSLSLAAYYLVLGLLRAHLSHAYKVRNEKGGLKYERKCYRSTAWLLFLLNIPMGGMTALMVLTDSRFSYPGYVIYLSAIYTFYISTVSVVNLVRYRKLGSPVLSAAKVLNVVAAMMSVLGLQTAMISRFSPTDNAYFARTMNTVTGAAVCFGVIVIAVFMLIKSRKTKSEVFSTYE